MDSKDIGKARIKGVIRPVKTIDKTHLAAEGVVRVVYRDHLDRRVTAFIPPEDLIVEF